MEELCSQGKRERQTINVRRETHRETERQRDRERDRERKRERCYFLVVGLGRPRPLLSPSGTRSHRRVSITGESS